MGKRKQKASVAEQRRLTDRAHEIVEHVMPRVEETYDHARVKAHDVVATAREQAPPLIEKGKATATEKASAAATKASVAGSAAGVAAGKAAAKAKEAAAEKVATVRPKPEPKKGKLKKLLLIGLLGAIGGVVFKKLKGGGQDNWQSSYVPTPPPPAPSEQSTTGPVGSAGSAGVSGAAAAASTSTAPPSSTDTTDDPAGADPAEALADATDEPHDVTTPDAPAEVTELIEKPKG